MEHKYHILYVSFEDSPEGRSYVGAHSTDDLNDGYMGSFVDKTFSPDYKIIVGYYTTRTALLRAEETLQKSLNVVKDDHYANQSIQHGSGFTHGFYGKTHTPEFREALAERNRSPESRQRTSQRNKEREWTQESRQKIAQATSRIKKGVKLSPEHRANIGAAQLGYKNHAFGKRWANNGIEEKKFNPSEKLPEGWTFGRIKKPT